MSNTVQVNYWTIGGFEGKKPPEQAITEAKEMGYGGIELCFDGAKFGPGIGDGDCVKIKEAAAAAGMKIETLASGTYWAKSLGSPDDAERAEAVAYTKEYLKVAKLVGASVVLVIPGAVAVPWDDSRPVVPYQTVWDKATESIKELVPAAEEAGVAMGMENVWNWFLADPMAMKTFVDQFGSDKVGVYFDVGNCQINGYAEHWIEILGARIKAVHLKNFNRDDCGGVLHGFGDDIMTGAVNWDAVKAALKTVGYQGALTAEMVPFSRLPDLVLPDMALAKDTAEKLNKLFA